MAGKGRRGKGRRGKGRVRKDGRVRTDGAEDGVGKGGRDIGMDEDGRGRGER